MVRITNAQEFWEEAVRLELPNRHLSLMNQNWWPEPPWKALEPFAKLGRIAHGRPELVLPLIEHPNWRFNLFGTAFAIFSEEKELLGPLIKKIGESWAAPQVASGVIILSSYLEDAERANVFAPLGRLIDSADPRGELKFVMSAYAVLRSCNKQAVEKFETRQDFSEFWRSGAVWYDMTRAHYHYWMGVTPYLFKITENV